MRKTHQTRKAGLYCRISADRTGQQAGVTRQKADGEALAHDRGWAVVGVYVDNDISAFSCRSRPEYRRMLDDLRNGAVDAVIAWHPDRLYRRMTDLEEFIEVVEAAGADVATVKAGDIDLATPSGRMVARNLGVAAAYESEHKAERLQRKHDEIAAAGRWKGGPRPYGYRPVGDGQLELVDGEAAVVREAAQRLLAGESVYGVVGDLNRRGVRTTKGAAWRTPTLRRILTAPGTAGLRDHKGEIIGEAAWPAIISRTEWERLVAIITDPTRHREAPRRCFLLTGGIAVCGTCGLPLIGQRRQSGARVYVCGKGPDYGGCGKLSCNAEPLEALIVEAVIQRLDTPALARTMSRRTSDDAPAAKDLTDIDRRLSELADMFAQGDIGRSEWLRARQGLEKRQQSIRASLRRDRRTAALDRYAGSPGALRAAWPTLTLDQQRAVVEAITSKVNVSPTAKRGRRFDEDRVDVEWRV